MLTEHPASSPIPDPAATLAPGAQLPDGGNPLVVVQAEWNGWRTATVRLADLADVRWLQPPGAPRPLIHASIDCTRLVSGDLSHACDPATAPHPLVVCVLKSHAALRVYEELQRRAGETHNS